MPTKKEREEGERVAAEWRANEERVNRHGDAFNALPDGPAKIALRNYMTDRIVELYNECKMEEGDAILEFLPNDYAKKLLDWYFHETDERPYEAAARVEVIEVG